MKNPVGNVVWFEIPADNVKRAQKFYKSLFGWKIKQMPGMEYWHIDTGGEDASPDGGMMKRKDPRQPITNYVFVESVDKAAAKVKKLGGKICVPKTAVGEMGFFAVCMDTENNVFAVWERNPAGK
ncbi:MAG TPA: VOC family protein [Candidatus Nitrosotalea sp.]|nr:VOC family protein [Candidatus Nitrosotalea sp.]